MPSIAPPPQRRSPSSARSNPPGWSAAPVRSRTHASRARRGGIPDPTRQVIERLTADRDALRNAANVLRQCWVNAAADRDALRAKHAGLRGGDRQNSGNKAADVYREQRFGRLLAAAAFIVGLLAGMGM